MDKRAHLDVMEKLLKEEQVTISKLDQETWELLEEAKEGHAKDEAHANASVKLQEDLCRCVDVVTKREQKVAEREREQQKKEEEIINKLECVRSKLTSCTIDLSTREATMEAEHECLRKTREDLCNRQLTISFQEGSLASCTIALALRERELANKEKRLAKKELHELAATRRKVEELQAVRGSRRRRSRIS
jgi:hypothetical protein